MLMLAPALGEELLFRGYMQRRLLWCWSPAAAIGVATVCFSLLHIPVWWFLAVVPLGAWFGIVAWRTNSIWPSVACHAAVNGYWTLWPLCHVAGWVPEDRPWGFLPVELVVSGICLGFSLRWFVRLDATALSITPEPVLVTPRVVAEGALLD
jgi:membrane protease YdiL (CAAX protease family)